MDNLALEELLKVVYEVDILALEELLKVELMAYMLDEEQVVQRLDYSLKDMPIVEDSLKEDNYFAKKE